MAVGPKQTSPGAFSVLPLPPLEYDVQYQNQIIRILNFIIQQLQTPGAVRTDSLTVTDRDQDTQFIVNPKELTETLTILAKNLPTTTTATVDTQIWNDGGFLKILPAGNPGNLNADTVTANHVHVADEVTANTVSATTSVSTATVNATTVDATTVDATTVNATTVTATGAVSGNTLSATTSVSAASAGITGAVSAGSVTSTGTVHGNALTATTSVSAASGSITGTLSAGAVTSTGTISGNALSASTSVSAASASISGNVGAGSVSASSSVSGNSVSASYLTSGTLTLNSIPTSPSGPSGTVWRDGSGYLRIV